jgi:orotate phosphoribosyltransferase
LDVIEMNEMKKIRQEWKEELRKGLVETGIVSMVPVKKTDGTQGNVYFDVKKAYGNPRLLNSLAEEIYLLFPCLGKEHVAEVTCVAAFGYGGIPLAAAISSQYDLPLTLIRTTPKDHGLMNEFMKYLEGYVPRENDNIAVIDDVLITGKSYADTQDILRQQTDANIDCLYVVVKQAGVDFPFKFKYLFESKDFLSTK